MSGGEVASPANKIEQVQWTEAVIQVAANYNSFVIAHVYRPRPIKKVGTNCVKGIEHGN